MAFLGMRGTGEWPEDYEPEDWRETILYLYPNGMAPLTAMLSMLGSRSVGDPTFNWWAKGLPKQGGAVTNVWNDPSLTSDFTGAASAPAETVLYVQAAAAVVEEFRVGHTCLLRKSTDNRYDTHGKVVSRILAGVKLLKASNVTYNLNGVDRILIIGNMNPEGAHMPDAISYEPVKYENVTQIWRTPLSITRTARKTRVRTGDAYEEMKREALELHAIEMEKSFIWGTRYEGIGDNNQPERATMGIIEAGRTYNAAGFDNYALNTSFSGVDWLVGGDEWLNQRLEVAFRYGRPEKMGLAGSAAVLAINNLAKANGQYTLTNLTVSYGLAVTEWQTPFGILYLKTHPLFSYEPTNQNDILIFEPQNFGFAYIDDTMFIEDPQDRKNRNNSKDATEEEFLTEAGLEWDHAETISYLSGVGVDNALS
jgi:hypothetical protein